MNKTKAEIETMSPTAVALSQVMAESGMTIPISEFNSWRPTKVSTGEIQGITKATILATDGNIGVFRDELNGEFFKGHVGWFSGEVETLYGVPKKDNHESRDTSDPEEQERLKDLDALLAKWGKVSHATQATQGLLKRRAKGPKVKGEKSQGLTKAFKDLESLGL